MNHQIGVEIEIVRRSRRAHAVAYLIAVRTDAGWSCAWTWGGHAHGCGMVMRMDVGWSCAWTRVVMHLQLAAV